MRFYDLPCEFEDEFGTSAGTVTDRAMDYFLVARDAKTKPRLGGLPYAST